MSPFAFNNLRSRLVWLVLIAMLPALGLILYTAFDHRRQAAAHVKAEAMRLVRLASSHEKHLISSTRQLLASLAELEEVRELDPVQCSPLLAKVLRQYPQYVNLAAADMEGNIFCSATPLPPQEGTINVSDRLYFQQTLKLRDFSVGNYQIDRIARKPTVHFGYPVFDDRGDIKAVMLASLDLSWFNSLAVDIKLPKGAALTVRDRNGTILTRYPDPEEWMARSMPDASILRAILAQHGEGIAEARGVDDVLRMYAFSTLHDSGDAGVYVSAGIPSAVAYAESNEELVRNLVGLAMAALLAMLLARFCGNLFVMRRLEILIGATRRLAAGDLSTRVAEGAEFQGPEELCQLARSFDEMAGSIDQRTLDLSRAEAKYRTLVEHLPAVTYTAALDEVRSAFYVSPEIESVLGYSAEEWTADPVLWLKRLHTGDCGRVRGEVLRVIDDPDMGEFHSEYRMLHRDGRMVWIGDAARVMHGKGKERPFLQGILYDITERKETEQALRDSENMYRAIFETTGTATIIVEEDTTISLANVKFEGLSGYSKEELENRVSWTSFFGGDDLQRMRGYHRYRRIDPKLAPSSYESRFIDRSGDHRYVFLNVAMIPGTKKSVISLLDISEERLARDALRRSEEHYRRFFEEDLAGDFIAGPDGSVKAYNPAFAVMFAVGAEEGPERHTIAACFDEVESWNEFLSLLKSKGRLEYWDAGLRRFDGKPVHVIGNVIGAFDTDGELREIRGYLFDNTDRKRLEEQLRQAQKMEAVGRLAGGVAHDFNNLLTVISGYSDMVLAVLSENDPLRQGVEQIRKAGGRAAMLTQQLLAFSRKQVFQLKVIDLNTVVSDMKQMLHRLIGEHIELITQLDPRLCKVEVDVGQVQQVIMNLVVNSRDAMPDGGEIRIVTSNAVLGEDAAIEYGVKAGSYALLSLADNGMGMDDETLSQAFEPFFSTKEEGKGTGLGLATVYGIVKQSKGGIIVRSELRMGTAVRILLPAHSSEAGTEGVANAGNEVCSPSGNRETILLVEDDEMVRGMARRMLLNGGYGVIEARHGGEALRICGEYDGPIHLMITDVVMPRMGGRKTAESLAVSRPRMKVMYMSGYSEDVSLLTGVAEGEIAFLQKPFGRCDLLKKVRETLDEE